MSDQTPAAEQARQDLLTALDTIPGTDGLRDLVYFTSSDHDRVDCVDHASRGCVSLNAGRVLRSIAALVAERDAMLERAALRMSDDEYLRFLKARSAAPSPETPEVPDGQH